MDHEEEDYPDYKPQLGELGPCCACRQATATVLMFLRKLAPVPGTGWGNTNYGWPSDGAVAVVCDRCLATDAPLLDAVAGYVPEGGRVPFESLQGEFGTQPPPDQAIEADEDREKGDESAGIGELAEQIAAYMEAKSRPVYRYILVDGVPTPEPDLVKWAMWMELCWEQMIVAQNYVGEMKIATSFLGLDFNFDGPEPILYETMIFDGPLDMEQKRYATVDQARAGHDAMVQWAKFVQSQEDVVAP